MTIGTVVRRKESEHPFSDLEELEDVGIIVEIYEGSFTVRMDGLTCQIVRVLWSQTETIIQEYMSALEVISESR